MQSGSRDHDHDEVHITLDVGVVLIVPAPSAASGLGGDAHHHEHRLQRLIDRLPRRLKASALWLRRPSSRWARIPAGAALSLGGMLSFLPFLGIWMLPCGLMLLAEDSPMLWRARGRVLHWMARRRPHWFAISPDMQSALS